MLAHLHPRAFLHITRAQHKQSRVISPGADTSLAHLSTSSLRLVAPTRYSNRPLPGPDTPLAHLSTSSLSFLRLMLLNSAGEREVRLEESDNRLAVLRRLCSRFRAALPLHVGLTLGLIGLSVALCRDRGHNEQDEETRYGGCGPCQQIGGAGSGSVHDQAPYRVG
jgi:hypothetical protein